MTITELCSQGFVEQGVQTKILGLVPGNSVIIFFKADLHGPCSTVY